MRTKYVYRLLEVFLQLQELPQVTAAVGVKILDATAVRREYLFFGAGQGELEGLHTWRTVAHGPRGVVTNSRRRDDDERPPQRTKIAADIQGHKHVAYRRKAECGQQEEDQGARVDRIGPVGGGCAVGK